MAASVLSLAYASAPPRGGVKRYVGNRLSTHGAPEMARHLMIGNNSSATGRTFDGFVDEVRIMGVPKDANWLKPEYESAKPGQRFLTFGAGT
jgi:hypothetical protein